MKDLPFTFTIPQPDVIPSRVDNHIQRRLSALRGQFADQDAYARLLAQGDALIYEVYEIQRPEFQGELIMGVSIVHPGKVGREFYMTKGHYQPPTRVSSRSRLKRNGAIALRRAWKAPPRRHCRRGP